MKNKFTIDYKSSILFAMQKIDDNQEKLLICIDQNDKVRGTITDGDIRRFIIINKIVESTVESVMSKTFDSLNVDAKFRDIAEKFRSNKIDFLPIIDDGVFKNILTKKQFHIMLLEDMKINLLQDFSLYDTKVLEHEIYNKPWGFYKSTLYTDFAQSKIITVFPDEMLSLQEHKHREEHWIVIKGTSEVVLGESVFQVNAGEYVFIPKGVKHRIINLSKTENLIFAEVQLGKYFGEDDIVRYEDKYNRI